MTLHVWQFRKHFFVVLVMFVICILGITAYTMKKLRDETLVSGLEAVAWQSQMFESYVTNSLLVADTIAVSALGHDGQALQPEALTMSFHVALKHAPFFRSISLVDVDGRITQSSNPSNIGALVNTSRFLPVAYAAHENLRIGTPWEGRDFSDGKSPVGLSAIHPTAKTFIPATQTVKVSDRTMTLLVAINPDYFLNFFQQNADVDNTSVDVINYDGVVLLSTDLQQSPGVLDSTVDFASSVRLIETGTFLKTHSENSQDLISIRASSLFPFHIVVRNRLDHVLKTWTGELYSLLSVVTIVLLALIALSIVFIRRQNQIAEQAAENDRLAHVNAACVFTHAREGIMITDANARITDVNDAFTHLTGFDRSDVLGKRPQVMSSGQYNKKHYKAMWAMLLEHGHWQGELWNKRKDGEFFACMQTISAVKDAQGKTHQYVSLFSDITAIKEHAKELERVAYFDSLTGLPNRILLADRLHQAMIQSVRSRKDLAVVYIDLDGFKDINDHFGHAAGDVLLKGVAKNMKSVLRSGDTLARLGGDEFVAVLVGLSGYDGTADLLMRLLRGASQSVAHGPDILRVTASLGVACYPQPENMDADQLLRQADQAMYKAKVAGKNRFHVFDSDRDRDIRSQHEGLERVRRGLLDEEFVLYYQPKVNIHTGEVVGAEALIRWHHPEQGFLVPSAFLPFVTNNMVSIDMGEWVLKTALTQLDAWRSVGLHLPISVNIDALHLQQPSFEDRLRTLLAAHPDYQPDDIEIEILETSALADIAETTTLIKRCQSLGVSFALDDFGTGYSSLTYLKQLSVNHIKIDQSFVREMLSDPETVAILKAVLGLSEAFNCKVTAEGVETMEHEDMLKALGCEFVQGYSIAYPMPANEIVAWVKDWKFGLDKRLS